MNHYASMIKFAKANYLFLLATSATLVSLSWLFIAPDFEPIVTTLLGIVTCISLRPKDWMFIFQRSGSELPKKFYHENVKTSGNFVVDNTEVLNSGATRFSWSANSLQNKDKSIEFVIKTPEYYIHQWKQIPVRIVLSTLSNSYGDNQHFLYAYIPDKPPICFYQFDAVCSEITVIDIDEDGIPELLVGYKCGAHTEGIRVFKLDKNLSFYLVEGSDIGSDYPLITWGKNTTDEFYITAYSRNWEMNREKWDSRYDAFLFDDSKFRLKTAAKVKWKNS